MLASPESLPLPPAPVLDVPVASLVEVAAPESPPTPLAFADEAPVPPDTALPVDVACASPDEPPLLLPRTAPDEPLMTRTAMPPVPPPPLVPPVLPEVPAALPVSPDAPLVEALPPDPELAPELPPLLALPLLPLPDLADVPVLESPDPLPDALTPAGREAADASPLAAAPPELPDEEPAPVWVAVEPESALLPEEESLVASPDEPLVPAAPVCDVAFEPLLDDELPELPPVPVAFEDDDPESPVLAPPSTCCCDKRTARFTFPVAA